MRSKIFGIEQITEEITPSSHGNKSQENIQNPKIFLELQKIERLYESKKREIRPKSEIMNISEINRRLKKENKLLTPSNHQRIKYIPRKFTSREVYIKDFRDNPIKSSKFPEIGKRIWKEVEERSIYDIPKRVKNKCLYLNVRSKVKNRNIGDEHKSQILSMNDSLLLDNELRENRNKAEKNRSFDSCYLNEGVDNRDNRDNRDNKYINRDNKYINRSNRERTPGCLPLPLPPIPKAITGKRSPPRNESPIRLENICNILGEGSTNTNNTANKDMRRIRTREIYKAYLEGNSMLRGEAASRNTLLSAALSRRSLTRASLLGGHLAPPFPVAYTTATTSGISPKGGDMFYASPSYARSKSVVPTYIPHSVVSHESSELAKQLVNNKSKSIAEMGEMGNVFQYRNIADNKKSNLMENIESRLQRYNRGRNGINVNVNVNNSNVNNRNGNNRNNRNNGKWGSNIDIISNIYEKDRSPKSGKGEQEISRNNKYISHSLNGNHIGRMNGLFEGEKLGIIDLQYTQWNELLTSSLANPKIFYWSKDYAFCGFDSHSRANTLLDIYKKTGRIPNK